MRDDAEHHASRQESRWFGLPGLGLILALMVAATPFAALADKHEAGGSGEGEVDSSASQDGEWVLRESFGPAGGHANMGDGAFFTGGQSPILHEDRVYQERWIDLDENQTLVVTVRSSDGMPDFLVLDQAGANVGGLVTRQPARREGGVQTGQLELLAPYSGRYRILLTSLGRFQDLVDYEVEAAIFDWQEPEPLEEPEVEIDPDAPDFSDFNDPPER